MLLSIYCAKGIGSLKCIPPLEFAISSSLDDQALSAVKNWSKATEERRRKKKKKTKGKGEME